MKLKIAIVGAALLGFSWLAEATYGVFPWLFYASVAGVAFCLWLAAGVLFSEF